MRRRKCPTPLWRLREKQGEVTSSVVDPDPVGFESFF
jgi:hypothetical protein